MALVLVRVEQKKLNEFNEHGQIEEYHRGDWIKIGKQRALELIELGRVSIPGTKEAQELIIGDMSDCGIVIRAGIEADARHILQKHEIAVQVGGIEQPFDRTLLWKTILPMTPERMALGFTRIEERAEYPNWEMAVMLRGQDHLIAHIGPKEEREGTKELLGDLRLPVYETAAVWIRKTRATEKFMSAWREFSEQGVGDEHAIIRALYTNRVILCTLPTGWLARWIGM